MAIEPDSHRYSVYHRYSIYRSQANVRTFSELSNTKTYRLEYRMLQNTYPEAVLDSWTSNRNYVIWQDVLLLQPIQQLQPLLLKLLTAGFRNTTRATDYPCRNFSHPTQRTYLVEGEFTDLLKFLLATNPKDIGLRQWEMLSQVLNSPNTKERMFTFMNTHNLGLCQGSYEVPPDTCNNIFPPEFLGGNPL